jgi:hypothetical protein
MKMINEEKDELGLWCSSQLRERTPVEMLQRLLVLSEENRCQNTLQFVAYSNMKLTGYLSITRLETRPLSVAEVPQATKKTRPLTVSSGLCYRSDSHTADSYQR